MEAEVRAILQERLAPRVDERGLGSRVHARFAGIDDEGPDDGLDVPDRSDQLPRGAVFDE